MKAVIDTVILVLVLSTSFLLVSVAVGEEIAELESTEALESTTLEVHEADNSQTGKTSAEDIEAGESQEGALAEEVVEATFSAEQIELNQSAAEATQAGDYLSAEEHFRASLELGESNVTWLNLGRMFARAGKCLDARDAYARVRTAPKLQVVRRYILKKN